MEKFFDLIIAITTGEKSALPVLRTMIDVLSIIVLANYLFKWSFADYELVNLYDYKAEGDAKYVNFHIECIWWQHGANVLKRLLPMRLVRQH